MQVVLAEGLKNPSTTLIAAIDGLGELLLEPRGMAFCSSTGQLSRSCDAERCGSRFSGERATSLMDDRATNPFMASQVNPLPPHRAHRFTVILDYQRIDPFRQARWKGGEGTPSRSAGVFRDSECLRIQVPRGMPADP